MSVITHFLNMLPFVTYTAEGEVGLITVTDMGTGRVILNDIIKDNSPLAVTSDSNIIRVKFSEFSSRRKRDTLPGFTSTEGALIQFLSLDELLSKWKIGDSAVLKQ